LRLMFVIDQLHDFLEAEERNLLFSNNKRDEDEKQARRKTITSLYDNIITHFVRGVVDCIKHFIGTDNAKAELENYNVKATSVFFQEELPFFELIFKYIGINSIEEPLDIEDKPFLIKNDSNKYLIQDELLLIIFSIKKINIDDSFKKHNAQYTCGENFDYINQLTQANYDSRYYPGEVEADTDSINITVDADRSKYGVSDIVKQACKLNNNNMNFVKTLATHYDASTTSTTENMLRYIKKRNGSGGGLTDVVNIKDISKTSGSVNYKLTIKDYVIMDFTYSVETATIDPIIQIFETIVETHDEDIPTSRLFNVIKSTYNQQAVGNINRILTNLKQFVKLYKFEDGTTVFTGPKLIIKDFMAESPYGILGFPANVRDNEIVNDSIFSTILAGLFKLYKIHSDKITLYDFMSEIFPTYKPVIKLYINKYFEIKKSDKLQPEFNSTNSSVRDITNTIITQPEFFNNLATSQDVLYLMAYKTLGDFGQILSFYATNPVIFANFGDLPTGRKRNAAVPSRYADADTVQPAPRRRRTAEPAKRVVGGQRVEYKSCDLQIDDPEDIRNSYINLDKNTIIPSEKIKLFITFDRSCSRISSIFNHGTIFENASMSLSPLELFENICMAKDIEAVIGGASLFKLISNSRPN